MDDLTRWLTELVDAAPAWSVYLIACSVVYLETAIVVVGLIAPSEAVLIAAGVVAAIGKPNIGVLVVSCAIAALAGDTTGYWLGRAGGPRFMKTKIGHRMVRRTRRSGYHPPGAKDAFIAVAAARWVSYVRSVSPLLAGSRRMPYRRYAVATAVGGTTWSATILLVSYGVGATLGAKVALVVVVCVAGLALLVLLIRRLMAHRAVADERG
ncbi:DedA family protein [Gordonia sp. (in: high G+C Gram-positive bacteria)]|uniref:DedA family protein n=1 Tax=Gordonia sp. (in: high G+C Gram-positive bacteria) TaxID=84139 RepID=UPI001697564E|nr:DedA family protein [Gordonia sp. (in: high G+C Gram-positive bacteria)]NLG47622.1 DedA family protein [Gordonia sp. (in: high G+C Gram-positive bacteria)]